MADQPTYLPPLTELESKALELLISSDRPLRDTAKSLGVSADQLLDLVESPSLKPYLAVATWATQQSQFFAAAKYHRENLESLTELASDKTADPALRLRACLTIFRGVPPAPRLDLPIRPLAPVTPAPPNSPPNSPPSSPVEPRDQPAPTPATRDVRAAPRANVSATAALAKPGALPAPNEPILKLNRKAAALRSSERATTQATQPSASPLRPAAALRAVAGSTRDVSSVLQSEPSQPALGRQRATQAKHETATNQRPRPPPGQPTCPQARSAHDMSVSDNHVVAATDHCAVLRASPPRLTRETHSRSHT